MPMKGVDHQPQAPDQSDEKSPSGVEGELNQKELIRRMYPTWERNPALPQREMPETRS